jgi:uncharacterized membrane protein YoaK (UPF0700 family)
MRIPAVLHAAKIKEHDVSRGPLIGLVLTALAGWVDAIGYLRLGGFFPSFMRGNTTQLGIALSHANWISAALPALLVGLFVTGAFAGAAITDSGARWRFVLCFLLETLLLGTAVVLTAAQSNVALAVAPLPIAMGLQNVTARRVNESGVGITFVTGTLVRLGEALAGAARRREGLASLIPALTWLAMTAGAVGGAAAHIALGPFALALPAFCAALATVLAAGAVRSSPSS